VREQSRDSNYFTTRQIFRSGGNAFRDVHGFPETCRFNGSAREVEPQSRRGLERLRRLFGGKNLLIVPDKHVARIFEGKKEKIAVQF
jgi:hypothetical protein